VLKNLTNHTFAFYKKITQRAVFKKPSPMIFWAHSFALSKFAELMDTVFLVLKHPDRPVPFLHWFHHFTVLLFTWYAAYYRYSAGAAFITVSRSFFGLCIGGSSTSVILTFLVFYVI